MGRISSFLVGAGLIFLLSGIAYGADMAILCSATQGVCEVEYNEGEVVNLTVLPVDGYVFIKWGGDCIHAGHSKFCTLVMTEDKVIEAIFAPKPPKPIWRRNI